jgi:heme exporter protein C
MVVGHGGPPQHRASPGAARCPKRAPALAGASSSGYITLMVAYANPAQFLRLADVVLPWAMGLTALLLGTGIYLSFFVAPPDYQQGESVRIMFVHVPAAWMALVVYAAVALMSAIGLVLRHPLAFLAAKAAAPIGACFTALALITGSLWGKPMWGAWWVWDARLTSVLVLFFLYLGYIAVWSAIEEPGRAARVAAVVALVGAINLPIIKFSVTWWNTLHQPASVLRTGGPSIDPSLLMPLLVMALAFLAYFVTVLLIRLRGEILAARLRAAQRARAGW